MQIRHASTAVIALGIWALSAGAALAQAPVVNPPVIAGANVSLSWSATAGATSYNILAGIAPGAYINQLNVGNVTSVQVVAPAALTYYVRIVAVPGGETSEEVAIPVTSLTAPPAAPTGLTAYRNGTNVVISWTPGAGGGPVSAFQLRAGLTPGGSELGVIPTGATTLGASGIPANTYYLGVRAVNPGGSSAESDEFALVMPPGGACDAPPAPSLTTTAWGSFLTAAWTPIPGAGAYLFGYSGPIAPGFIPFGGGTTSFVYPSLPQGTWNFTVQAQFSCGATGAAGGSTLVVDGTSLKLTPRAPDPPGPTPPNYLPLPNRASVVNQIAAQYPGDLRNSCVEHGGNNRFLFRVVQALRQEDKRWGLNWKRNNVGDMSQDVITYNYGSDPDEGTRWVHVVDIIGGHCGNNPSANWQDQTQIFSTGATWTLFPYIQAGYIP